MSVYVFSRQGLPPYRFEISGAAMPFQQFFGTERELMGECRDNVCTIYSHYKWNGCSPKLKIKLFGKVILLGTTDGPNIQHWFQGSQYYAPTLYFATLEHDFLWQFMPKGITVKQMNNRFKYSMRKAGWKWRGLYYCAVKVWSVICRKRKQES